MANYTRELVHWKRTVQDINTRIVMTTDDFSYPVLVKARSGINVE